MLSLGTPAAVILSSTSKQRCIWRQRPEWATNMQMTQTHVHSRVSKNTHVHRSLYILCQHSHKNISHRKLGMWLQCGCCRSSEVQPKMPRSCAGAGLMKAITVLARRASPAHISSAFQTGVSKYTPASSASCSTCVRQHPITATQEQQPFRLGCETWLTTLLAWQQGYGCVQVCVYQHRA